MASRKQKRQPDRLEDANDPRMRAGRMPDRVASPVEVKDVASSSSRQLPPVSLTVFLVSSGKKPDQMAGFKAWATVQKLGPRTIPEWHETYNDFMARPVK